MSAITIGKKAIKNTIIIFDAGPIPNAMMITGNRATLGVTYSPEMKGLTTALKLEFQPDNTPIGIPISMAKTKPETNS